MNQLAEDECEIVLVSGDVTTKAERDVASSEVYPTWDESALRANILAIVSFALNRVYTEFYRSRGYDFDITNSTAYDQFFVNGRSFFSNISQLVDELFNDYLRRPGFVEPLAAKFCNGTTACLPTQKAAHRKRTTRFTLSNTLSSYLPCASCRYWSLILSFPSLPERGELHSPNK